MFAAVFIDEVHELVINVFLARFENVFAAVSAPFHLVVDVQHYAAEEIHRHDCAELILDIMLEAFQYGHIA